MTPDQDQSHIALWAIMATKLLLSGESRLLAVKTTLGCNSASAASSSSCAPLHTPSPFERAQSILALCLRTHSVSLQTLSSLQSIKTLHAYRCVWVDLSLIVQVSCPHSEQAES
jgi:hypothetical protein